jgi:hypothetical protein
MIPRGAERVEMVDGRVYYSLDNWTTVFLVKPSGKPRRISGKDADLARFLAISQSSWSA